MQNLLLGMNAHINLDLGIAAVQTCGGADLIMLKDDFLQNKYGARQPGK